MGSAFDGRRQGAQQQNFSLPRDRSALLDRQFGQAAETSEIKVNFDGWQDAPPQDKLSLGR
jgi:hypothetical protein